MRKWVPKKFIVVINFCKWTLLEISQNFSIVTKGKISTVKISEFKCIESRYKQCAVTPHFSIGQNLLKKYRKKINIGKIYWKKILREGKSIQKQLRKAFWKTRWTQIVQYHVAYLWWLYLSKTFSQLIHCIKSVCIWSCSGPYFPAFRLNKNQNNTEYGHFYAVIV